MRPIITMGFPWNVNITWKCSLINFDKKGARQRNCVQQAESMVYNTIATQAMCGGLN
jgi:hypothetical protein